MKKLLLLVVVLAGCGTGSQKAAGWGLAGAGIGLTLYTTGNTISTGARVGEVDGVAVGVQYGISAFVVILGAIIAGTAPDLAIVEKELPRIQVKTPTRPIEKYEPEKRVPLTEAQRKRKAEYEKERQKELDRILKERQQQRKQQKDQTKMDEPPDNDR